MKEDKMKEDIEEGCYYLLFNPCFVEKCAICFMELEMCSFKLE